MRGRPGTSEIKVASRRVSTRAHLTAAGRLSFLIFSVPRPENPGDYLSSNQSVFGALSGRVPASNRSCDRPRRGDDGGLGRQELVPARPWRRPRARGPDRPEPLCETRPPRDRPIQTNFPSPPSLPHLDTSNASSTPSSVLLPISRRPPLFFRSGLVRASFGARRVSPGPALFPPSSPDPLPTRTPDVVRSAPAAPGRRPIQEACRVRRVAVGLAYVAAAEQDGVGARAPVETRALGRRDQSLQLAQPRGSPHREFLTPGFSCVCLLFSA